MSFKMDGTDSHSLIARARKFLSYSGERKYISVAWRLRRAFPFLPLPIRLRCGGWLILKSDELGGEILDGKFELGERDVVDRLLQPGMTMLDVGAHHGLYSVIGGKRVGRGGKVYAFEPSPRERKILTKHIRLNRLQNVKIEAVALGSSEVETELYIIDGHKSGCNSLRPPAVSSSVRPLKVHVSRLDDWLLQSDITRVDFVKLDVEGGELDVLKGAENLLARRPRPLILVEVQDVRTKPWGYPARDILLHLSRRGYQSFLVLKDGRIERVRPDLAEYDGNFLTCPEERLEFLKDLVQIAWGPHVTT